ncbi:MAG TPA: hypothetical protein VH678_22065 [Xanthobacteraceae bacterium]|jgi:hypothetical protein
MPGHETDNATTALNAIITALTPLTSEQRRRTVDAAMLFLGEKTAAEQIEPRLTARDGDAADNDGLPPQATKWMKQHGVSEEELERTFHFNGDGTFDIHDVPGKSKKDRTLNAYVLTGLGKFLSSNDRAFDDSTAREFCEKLGCYDPANHSVHIKAKGAEFSGDKAKGFTLTTIGMKRGAVIVKELASAAT